MNRDADKGRVGRLKAFMTEWGWAIAFMGTVLVGMGYSYKTPKDELNTVKESVAEVRADQSTLKAALDTLKDVTTKQAADISTMVRLQCFNSIYTTRELGLVGINCHGIRK